MRPGRRVAWRSLTLALAGAALVWWITPYGSGLSPDSVLFVATARSILAGDGVRSLDGGSEIRFPPLDPVALAAAAWVSRSDPVDAARWLNATLFAVLLGMAVLIPARIARRSPDRRHRRHGATGRSGRSHPGTRARTRTFTTAL